MEPRDLEFKDIIPKLENMYRKGLLVPFLGSGMSRGICCEWKVLLENLGKITGISTKSYDLANSSALIRLADEISSALRGYTIEDQIGIYRTALLRNPNTENSNATIELAKLYWPLVISTNYDDVFLNAANKGGNSKYSTEVLGRNIEDCHNILRSLEEVTSPKLWAIQGFVGGQMSLVDHMIPSLKKQKELASQVVLGHQQYQQAINSNLHFRRAFAEVFRRRSLLFLGSGILEDYLVNLFSEILHHQGVGINPHFALLKKSEVGLYNNLFMQRRLGIVPIFYSEHDDLPIYLQSFVTEIKYWIDVNSKKNPPPSRVIFQDELGFKLAAKAADGTIPLKVNIIKSPIPSSTDSKQCSVVSLGRDDKGALPGDQANGYITSYLKSNHLNGNIEWHPIGDNPSYIFRYGESSIFGLAARKKHVDSKDLDHRDLGIIPEAVSSILKELDYRSYETINFGGIAAGPGSPWHPIHPFAQLLLGIKKYISKNFVKHIKRINLYVVDPATWSAFVSGKIPVEALLTSEISTHTIETIDTGGATESFSLTLKESTTLKELLELCNVNRAKWDIQVFPSSGSGGGGLSDDIVIIPTMRLILTAK